MMRAACVWLGLAGCDVVFPLEAPPASPALETCTPDGLVLCLAFEDDVGGGVAIDLSPSHDNALATRVTQIAVVDQHAVSLAATSSMIVANEVPVNLGGSTVASLDLWFRYDGLAGVSEGLLDKDNQYGIELGSDGTVRCRLQLDTATNPVEARPSGPTVPGHWYHVACVKTETAVTLYLDGSPQADVFAVVGTLHVDPGGTLLRVGQDDMMGMLANPFIGQLDNVRVWNRAMEQADIDAAVADTHQ